MKRFIPIQKLCCIFRHPSWKRRHWRYRHMCRRLRTLICRWMSVVCQLELGCHLGYISPHSPHWQCSEVFCNPGHLFHHHSAHLEFQPRIEKTHHQTLGYASTVYRFLTPPSVVHFAPSAVRPPQSLRPAVNFQDQKTSHHHQFSVYPLFVWLLLLRAFYLQTFALQFPDHFQAACSAESKSMLLFCPTSALHDPSPHTAQWLHGRCWAAESRNLGNVLANLWVVGTQPHMLIEPSWSKRDSQMLLHLLLVVLKMPAPWLP